MERRCRLKGRTRFLEIRRRGQRWAHPLVVLIGLASDLPLTRCGFVVSRRLGNAVARNRIRRRLREVVRLRYLRIAPGWDLVFIARLPIRQADFAEIAGAVEGLLRQAGLWRPQEDRGNA